MLVKKKRVQAATHFPHREHREVRNSFKKTKPLPSLFLPLRPRSVSLSPSPAPDFTRPSRLPKFGGYDCFHPKVRRLRRIHPDPHRNKQAPVDHHKAFKMSNIYIYIYILSSGWKLEKYSLLVKKKVPIIEHVVCWDCAMWYFWGLAIKYRDENRKV